MSDWRLLTICIGLSGMSIAPDITGEPASRALVWFAGLCWGVYTTRRFYASRGLVE